MAGSARRDIVREGEIGVYHTWSRCVQGAFLCGYDELTGTDFEYRTAWIKKLLEYQASVFACDIGNYSILSNHQHLIIRTRPDIADTWSDEEVAWRWKMAWPTWTDEQWVREPTDEEIEELLAKPDQIPILRKNLASLSWFHARWKEPIAKVCNGEMNKKGHFFEARFGSRELVDEAAVLCCSIYVDANQVQAGMTSSLEESHCSGIQDRITAWRSQEAEASVKKFHQSKDVEGDYELETSAVEELLADCFLAPIGQDGPLTSAVAVVSTQHTPEEGSPEGREYAEAPSKTGVISAQNEDGQGNRDDQSLTKQRPQGGHSAKKKQPQTSRRIHKRWKQRQRRRASDNVILPMPFSQYWEIAEWTAQQALGNEQDATLPRDLAATLREKEIDPKHWRGAVINFGNWFHRAVGSTSHLAGILQRLNRRWIQGIGHCRDVFT